MARSLTTQFCSDNVFENRRQNAKLLIKQLKQFSPDQIPSKKLAQALNESLIFYFDYQYHINGGLIGHQIKETKHPDYYWHQHPFNIQGYLNYIQLNFWYLCERIKNLRNPRNDNNYIHQYNHVLYRNFKNLSKRFPDEFATFYGPYNDICLYAYLKPIAVMIHQSIKLDQKKKDKAYYNLKSHYRKQFKAIQATVWRPTKEI